MANPPKKADRRRRSAISVPTPRHRRGMVAWAELPEKPKFLEESVFNVTAFDKQRSNLFTPEAEELRNALMQILESGSREESWKFLLAIHAINSKKTLYQAEMQTELKALEKQFIDENAPTRINLGSTVLNNIVAIEKKSPADYKNIIKEVFDLIRQNIKTNVMLTTIDEISWLKNSVNKLIATLNPLVTLETRNLGFMSAFLPTKTDTKLFINCQKICKAMQDDLRVLMKSYKVVDVVNSKDSFEKKVAVLSSLENDFKIKFAKILSNAQNKLNEKYAEMHKIEKVRGYSPKSEQVKLVIDAIKETNISLGLQGEAKSKSKLAFGIFKRVSSEKAVEEKKKPANKLGPR
jgi:hypothetical protein